MLTPPPTLSLSLALSNSLLETNCYGLAGGDYELNIIYPISRSYGLGNALQRGTLFFFVCALGEIVFLARASRVTLPLVR